VVCVAEFDDDNDRDQMRAESERIQEKALGAYFFFGKGGGWRIRDNFSEG